MNTMIRKRPVKLVKPRARKQLLENLQPLNVQEIGSTTELTKEVIVSIENTDPRLRLHKGPLPAAIPIEDYISMRSERGVSASLASILKLQEHDYGVIETLSSATVATRKAEDKAYSYLFKHLSGKCNGLNLIQRTVVSEVCDMNGLSGYHTISNTYISLTVIVYIQPGLKCRFWEDIEQEVEHIFSEAAANNYTEPEWHVDGVLFDVWPAN